MDRKERQWLVSVLMTIVMTMSVFSVPASAFAEDSEPFGGSIDTYINSDGQQIAVETTADGFVYQKVNSDGEEVVKVYGRIAIYRPGVFTGDCGNQPVIIFKKLFIHGQSPPKRGIISG